MTEDTSDSSNFGADGPFFRIIREGLEGLADGEDYFDLLTDDVVFEYVISVPGYPRRVEGRQNIIDLYGGYGDFMTVHSADNLRVYRDREAPVVVLEYEVHGESVQTGRPYDNRFVSIITVKDHKVTHWAGLPRPDRRLHRPHIRHQATSGPLIGAYTQAPRTTKPQVSEPKASWAANPVTSQGQHPSGLPSHRPPSG